jgi:hypothetical protein
MMNMMNMNKSLTLLPLVLLGKLLRRPNPVLPGLGIREPLPRLLLIEPARPADN